MRHITLPRFTANEELWPVYEDCLLHRFRYSGLTEAERLQNALPYFAHYQQYDLEDIYGDVEHYFEIYDLDSFASIPNIIHVVKQGVFLWE